MSTGISTRVNGIGAPHDFYPNPFFDVASTYIPSNIKDLFVWCQYYATSNPIVSAVIYKLATLSVTEIEATSEDASARDRVTNISMGVGLRESLIDMNLDFFTYGNAFASVVQPVSKTLTCAFCGYSELVTRRNYSWIGGMFHLNCPKCFQQGPAKISEKTIVTPELASIVRWNPQNVSIRRVGVSDRHKEYDLKIPRHLENQIKLGNTRVLESTPSVFLEAVRLRRGLTLSGRDMFHMSRRSMSRDETDDSLWGVPLIAPVLKDTFLYGILRKLQEARTMEHVLPMRLVYPQTTSSGSDVYSLGSLTDWQNSMKNHISEWRQDVNRVVVSPVAVGYTRIGGDGAYTSQQPELRGLAETIICGMGVPVGFFYGELAYSGGSVNLKALENEFGSLRVYDTGFVNFVIGKLLAGSGESKITATVKAIRLAEDSSKTAMLANLAANGAVSNTTLLSNLGLDPAKENLALLRELIERRAKLISEQEANAEAQGKAKIIAAKYDLEVAGMHQAQQEAFAAKQQQAQEEAQMDEMPQETYPEETPIDNSGGSQSYYDAKHEQDKSRLIGVQSRRAMAELAVLGAGDRDAYMQRLLSANPAVYQRVVELQQGSVSSMLDGALPTSNHSSLPTARKR